MVLIRAFFVLSTAVLLFGCASQSKTADQLRDNVQRNATFSSREVFEVKKPYRQVSDTLRIQHKQTGTGVTQLGGPPPEGFFIIVTDVYPIDKNTSRVDVQKHMPGYAGVIKAIRNWAEGTSKGCPDLAQ